MGIVLFFAEELKIVFFCGRTKTMFFCRAQKNQKTPGHFRLCPGPRNELRAYLLGEYWELVDYGVSSNSAKRVCSDKLGVLWDNDYKITAYFQ